MILHRSLAIGIVAAGVAQAMPAAAAYPTDVTSSLRRCGYETCLIVTGHRGDADAPVSVAGRDISVKGGRTWRVAIPLDTVEAWSAPFARTIAVRIGGAEGVDTQARLPVGLLGHVTTLASLDVDASR